MANQKPLHLLIDTSYLRRAGFNDPDFRLLLHFSKTDLLKIFVPHIVWEERRTQLLETAAGKIKTVSDAFDKLKAELPSNFVLDGLLPLPTLRIWTRADVDMKSKKAMTEFAAEHKIEIVPLAPDHANRAWERYFNINPPFDPSKERENRRKSIPDSWIFETAIDLHRTCPDLVALCNDGDLSVAMQSHGIRVLKDPRPLIDEIRPPIVETVEDTLRVEDSISVSVLENASITTSKTELEIALEKAREPFKDLDAKLIGYVAYLGTPTKDQLFDLLAQAGVSTEVAKNAAERLSICGVITDSGNHYLIKNTAVGDLATKSVELEIIKLLEEN
jgi:hypothetical protein